MSKTNIFIDSNIILDFLLEKEKFFESSANINFYRVFRNAKIYLNPAGNFL
jgi:predicted nucleic-acid-binding protein